MYFYALIINAVLNNLSAFGIFLLKLENYVVGGVLGVVALMEFLGSLAYKKTGINKSRNKLNVQINILFIYVFLILMLAIAKHFNNLAFMAISVMTISLLTPFWDTNNKLLLREILPKDKYGQFFGIVKIPRALMTSLGTLIFARIIDSSYVPGYLVVSALLLLAVSLVSRKMSMRQEKLND